MDIERETKSARLGAGDSSGSTLEEVSKQCEKYVRPYRRGGKGQEQYWKARCKVDGGASRQAGRQWN